jgi:starch synthase
LRVLSVTHFFESHGGGIERVAGHLCRQFVRLGAEPVWAASNCDAPPEGEIETVPLGCINPIEKLTGLPMPLPGIGAIRTLAREVRRSDTVLVHDALYATSIIALLLAKLFGKPVVLVQHIAGIPFSSRALRFAMTLANAISTRPMLWAADARVFISDTVRHDLLGTPSRHSCELLFNGVDAGIFHPMPTNAAAERQARRVLFVGRYVEKKGLAVLRALAATRPDLEFLFAGSGPLRPGEWGLANVHDLGPQSPHALAELYRSSDLLLLPSVGEGYPLVIQEAMACGLPVICGEPSNRADPDAARWLRGVVINLGDPQGTASRCGEAIDQLALSPAERAAMARYALQRYDWEVMARSLMSLARTKRAAALS